MAITKLPRGGIKDNAINASKIEDGTIAAAEISGTISAAKLNATLDISSKTVTLPNTIEKGETASKRTVALSKLSNQIKANEEATNIALEKEKRNERLTVAEVRLINRVLAFDTYSNIQNLELEAVKDLYNLLKQDKKASIAMLNASRLERAEINNDIYNQATSEIRENHPELFDKVTGEVLDSEKIDQIRNQMFSGTLKNKLTNWWNQYKFTSGIVFFPIHI